jgi:hypothetical protein
MGPEPGTPMRGHIAVLPLSLAGQPDPGRSAPSLVQFEQYGYLPNDVSVGASLDERCTEFGKARDNKSDSGMTFLIPLKLRNQTRARYSAPCFHISKRLSPRISCLVLAWGNIRPHYIYI